VRTDSRNERISSRSGSPGVTSGFTNVRPGAGPSVGSAQALCNVFQLFWIVFAAAICMIVVRI